MPFPKQITGVALSRLVLHIHTQVWRLKNRTDVSWSVAQVYWAVASKPGVTPSSISMLTGLSLRTISGVLKQQYSYDAESLFEQKEDKEDRRLRRIYLTATGEALLEECHKDLCDFRNMLILEEEHTFD